ncbi:MAG: hypothetical protein M1826_006299 [Phylliscum demangeonii]|nr:MAG: hypothetical protein M1826_006299 [Phylliscum demangeonii]
MPKNKKPTTKAAKPKMTWIGDGDRDLLLTILAMHNLKLDHVAIAQRMGPPCTPRAVEERLKKLRRMIKEKGFDQPSDGNAGTTDNGALVKAAPAKKSKAPKKASTKSAKGKAGPLKVEDESDTLEIPSRKRSFQQFNEDDEGENDGKDAEEGEDDVKDDNEGHDEGDDDSSDSSDLSSLTDELPEDKDE